MKDFAGKIAVVTGGGTGMGRELVRQLVSAGCNVAMCDIHAETMAEAKALCEAEKLPQGLRITTHIADVSDEAQVLRFRDEVAQQQNTDHIHLLFNNAGIGGGGSMIANERAHWERTFNIVWGGVYLCTRAFLPMMQKATEAHLINTSSVNGFWASIGPMMPHLAEECWARLGYNTLVANEPWPTPEPGLLVDDQVTIAVQVNGKRRDELKISRSASNEEVEAAALKLEPVLRALEGRPVKKVIVVPQRIVNVVG